MNCKQCGTFVPQDAAFCPECGTPVAAPSFADVPPVPGRPAAANARQGVPYNADILGGLGQSKFFNFFGAFINAMEQSGFFRKPLYWLYILFAALNVLVPVYFLFMMISNNLLDQLGVGGFLIWVVVAFAGWMGFQLWWNRKDKIGLYFQKGDDFYAIPLFSHYIQTTGEWLGMTLAIVGAGSSLIAWIFLSGRNSNFPLPLPMSNFGIGGLLLSPILGFTIILVSKVLAELYRALAAIANNTKQIALKR